MQIRCSGAPGCVRVHVLFRLFQGFFIFTPFFVFFSLYLLILLKYNLHEFSHRKCRIIVLLLCYYFVFSFFLLHAFFSRENCIFYSFIFVAFVVFFLEFSRAHRSFHGVQLLLCGQQGVGRQKDVCVCNLNCQLDVNVD